MNHRMSQLSELEELTGCLIPEYYRRLLADYPADLRNLTRAEDGSDSEGTVESVELIRDWADVLDINREVRSCSVEDPDGVEFCWPDSVLVIGENGEGDFYGLDLTGEYAGVLLFEHQAVQFEEITDSLDEFVQLIRECFAA